MAGVDLTLVLQCLALGVAAGFMAGLLGIGGGMMLVPFMTMLINHQGVPAAAAVKMAIATSGATILFTSVSSLMAHHRHGAVRWPLVGQFAPGIVIGGLVAGAGVLANLRGQWLAVMFAGFNAFMAWRMWRSGQPRPDRTLPGPAGVMGVGAAIGFLSALVGAGGAFLSVPFMTRCNVPVREAVGTSAALGFPIAAAATAGYVIGGWHEPAAVPGAFGFLYLPGVFIVAITSVAFAPVGARMTQRLPVTTLKRVFAVMLLALACYVAWKALHG